jgi:hypothetical protein
VLRPLSALVVAALLAAAPDTARAVGFPDADYYKALPCRPTIACTADIVPPGVTELELGYLYRRLGTSANQHSIPFLLNSSMT